MLSVRPLHWRHHNTRPFRSHWSWMFSSLRATLLSLLQGRCFTSHSAVMQSQSREINCMDWLQVFEYGRVAKRGSLGSRFFERISHSTKRLRCCTILCYYRHHLTTLLVRFLSFLQLWLRTFPHGKACIALHRSTRICSRHWSVGHQEIVRHWV
jgi:hypothetical protein